MFESKNLEPFRRADEFRYMQNNVNFEIFIGV